MKICTVGIRGVAPISFSRMIDDEIVPKMEGECAEDYDRRVWREKCHTDANGMVFVPGMAFKFSLDYTAKQLGLKIDGRGRKTWIDLFKTGVTVPYNLELGVHRDQLEMIKLNVHANGTRGSGKRVPRRFPVLQAWGGTLTFWVLNDEINEAIFHRHVVQAGILDGVGRYRAGVGGTNGRYQIESFAWQDNAEPLAAAA